VRGLLGELLSSQTEITVVDMEAGLEHLSRSGGTLRYVDHLLVVTEPYARAIETARRTVQLARELGIENVSLIANKVREPSDLRLLDALRSETHVDLIASIPYDEAARLADREGLPPIEVAPDSALVHAIEALAHTLDAQWAVTAV
jgi:CO dehydrogenase maturation factor